MCYRVDIDIYESNGVEYIETVTAYMGLADIDRFKRFPEKFYLYPQFHIPIWETCAGPENTVAGLLAKTVTEEEESPRVWGYSILRDKKYLITVMNYNCVVRKVHYDDPIVSLY